MTWRSAVGRHVVGVVVAMVVVGLLVGWQGDRSATAQAERTAEADVRTIALGLALPLASADLTGPTDDWSDALALAVEPYLETGDVAAVHLWQRPDDAAPGAGRLVWSSDADLADDVFPLPGPDVISRAGESLLTRLTDGGESQGPDVENLYEIYLGVADRTGRVYVLEVYKPVGQYDAVRASLLRDWLPVGWGGVVVLGLLTLPLSVRLARRTAAAELDRAEFADRALRARAEERLRLSEVLHERSIQDLAAAGLLLDTVRGAPVPEDVRRVHGTVRGLLDENVRSLRGLLESHDPGAGSTGELADAVAGWCTELGLDDVAHVEVARPLPLSSPAADLTFRVVKEALRNVAKHADASTVTVRTEVEDGHLVTTVADDGRGFDPDDAPARDGHVRLRVMRYAAASAGGALTIDTRPGAGTAVRLRVPVGG